MPKMEASFMRATIVTLLLTGVSIFKSGTCNYANSRRFLLSGLVGNNMSDVVKDMTARTNSFLVFPFATIRSRLREAQDCGVVSTMAGRVAPRPVGNCAACCNKNLDDAVELYFVGDRSCSEPTRIYKDEKSKNLWDPEKDVVLYLHGFGQGKLYQPGLGLCEAYARRPEKFNVLIGDHGRLLPFPWYANAVENIPFIAHTLVDRLIYYDSVGFMNVEKLHIIGHSLGAQIAAVIGHTIKKKLKTKLSRITGLDAAFPLIDGPDSAKLTSDDAEYVDAIHTNAGIFGFATPLGDADFYVNGGHLQPDCLVSINVCSHQFSIIYYTETVDDPYIYPISNNGTISYMGFLAKDSNARGSHNITTRKQRKSI